MATYTFLPESENGLNIKSEEDKEYVVNERFVELKEELQKSYYHLVKHKSLLNQNVSILSLAFVRVLDSIIVADLVDQSGQVGKRIALPVDYIESVIPLPMNDLESVKPRKVTNGKKESKEDYFYSFAKDFIINQDIKKLWEHNSND